MTRHDSPGAGTCPLPAVPRLQALAAITLAGRAAAAARQPPGLASSALA